MEIVAKVRKKGQFDLNNKQMKNITIILFLLFCIDIHSQTFSLSCDSTQNMDEKKHFSDDINMMRDSLRLKFESIKKLPDTVQYEVKCKYFQRWAADTLRIMGHEIGYSDDSLELTINDTICLKVRDGEILESPHKKMGEDVMDLLFTYNEIPNVDFCLKFVVSHVYSPTITYNLYEKKDYLLNCQTVDLRYIKTFIINDVGHITECWIKDLRYKTHTHYVYKYKRGKYFKDKAKP